MLNSQGCGESGNSHIESIRGTHVTYLNIDFLWVLYQCGLSHSKRIYMSINDDLKGLRERTENQYVSGKDYIVLV